MTHSAGRFGLVLASLGVVFGDIGTSPLYAFREAVAAATETGGLLERATVLGVLSLILWTLTLIVSVKYVFILLRADNHGEGGTLSLMALAQRGMGRASPTIVVLGIVGAALFYGDAAITPAISVLSAVEGLALAHPRMHPFVMPVTLAILVALFAIQRTGTGRVAQFFGPVTALWFVVIGVAGFVSLLREPSVLAAFNPWYAAHFIATHGFIGFVTLGAVFLCVTGAEALYADLGHFGRQPIQMAWYALVFPALALNYLGQGALVLADPAAAKNPFFLLFPDWSLLGVVALATIATVIASQAVISGAYSLTRQAIQLQLLPRMRILFTSETSRGQIYLPRINWILFTAVVVLTLAFGTSAALASAYGIAVTATMVVDALLAIVVLRHCWGWSWSGAVAAIGPFVLIALTFLSANSLKIDDGGWAPIMLGGILVMVMLTWRSGSRLLTDKLRRQELPLKELVQQLEAHPPHRVPGTAIFLTGNLQGAPAALLHNLKHNKIIHERNIVLTIHTEQQPRVPLAERVTIETLSPSFLTVEMRYGYMETPNLLRGLAACRRKGVSFEVLATSFYLSRRSLKASPNFGMPLWQDKLYIALASSADSATDYFHIPAQQVVEIGAQVTF